MSGSRPTLRIEAVPRDYDPGYPQRLTPAEFRALIERRTHQRVRQVAAAAALLLGVPSSDARANPARRQAEVRPVAPDDLERRALAVLTELRAQETWASWFRETRFQPVAEDGRKFAWSPQWSADIPISFGNSHNGVFDTALARQTAIAMFAAYGIDLQRDVDTERDGVKARIDGVDAETGLGFELRDREPFDSVNGPAANTRGPIPESERLDDGEAKRLHDEGLRIHVDDPQSLYDGDNFTAVLTYVAGLVDFLNEVTDGPELDLGTVLFGEKQRLHPSASTRHGATEHGGWVIQTTVREASVWKVRYNVPDAPPPQRSTGGQALARSGWTELEAPVPTAGRPTLLSFSWYRERGESPTVRVVQGDLAVDARSSDVFLPSAFDASKPFEVEFTVPPGEIHLDLSVVVGVPRR